MDRTTSHEDPRWPALTASEALARLATSPDGLSLAEAERRLQQHGVNDVPRTKTSWARRFLAQFQSPLVLILVAALVLSLAVALASEERAPADFLDVAAILVVLVANAALGLVQEARAEKALQALARLSAPVSTVRRAGRPQQVPSRVIVPGDILLLEPGDRVAADARILTSASLEAEEASLTGEAAPVAKSPDAAPSPHVAEWTSMVLAGTHVTRGSGTAVVTATGTDTQIGQVARLVAGTVTPETPLQARLRRLGMTMAEVVLVLAGIVMLVGVAEGLPFAEVVLVATSLAVSAVPEGLPAAVTLVFALGVQRMAERHALVRRLDALETMGCVTVICTDKTGTITQHEMAVRATWVPGAEHEADRLDALARAVASCNRANEATGDPTERGLLEWAEARGVERLPIDHEEVPFSSEARFMRTRHDGATYVKGAPDVILAMDSQANDAAESAAEAMTAEGLRVLAAAEHVDGQTRLLGLVGLEDPPRPGAAQAIEDAARAGIRTIMITGDVPGTALAIGRRVGLPGAVLTATDVQSLPLPELRAALLKAPIVARATPANKLRILDALRAGGDVVAMTGDGVNDAPALKGAHVGVAMGVTGTEVAREAAAIVLADDDYATIVAAIAEGRRIYDNVRRFVTYLLRANFDEILMVLASMVLRLPLPYLPLHILWLNLLTDGPPAVALGLEPAAPDVMRRPPRPPKESILKGQGPWIAGISAWSFLMTFAWFYARLQSGAAIEQVRAATLTAAVFIEIGLAFSARSPLPLWRTGLRGNPWLVRAGFAAVALQLGVLYTPLAALFHLAPVSGAVLAGSVVVALLGVLGVEVAKAAASALKW